MARDQPFNANPDTGRMGFRDPEKDPYPDERPTLVYRYPFWQDMEEELRYEKAVAACPVKEYGHLRFDEYLAEVVKLAEGMRPGGIKSMPDVEAARRRVGCDAEGGVRG